MRAQLAKNTEIIKTMFTKNVDNDVYNDETTTLFNILVDNNKCLTESEHIQEQQHEANGECFRQNQPQTKTTNDVFDSIKQTICYKLLTNDYSYVKTTLSEHKDNKDVFYAYGMLCLLNHNLTSNNIIELLNNNLVCYQWLGLYLKFNTNCHADDIIKLINKHVIHPYLALTMYSYQTPDDYITLYRTYHKKTLNDYEGVSVEMGIKDFINTKPLAFIRDILMRISDNELISKLINIFFYGQQLDKHPHIYKHDSLPNKLINKVSDLKLYMDEYKSYENKLFVKFNKNLINNVFDDSNPTTILNNIDCVIHYISMYWLTYVKNDYKCYFTINHVEKQIDIKDIMTMDINDNKLIIVEYLANAILNINPVMTPTTNT